MRRSEKLGMLTGLIVGTILLLISFLMGVKPVCKVWGSQTAYTASEAEKTGVENSFRYKDGKLIVNSNKSGRSIARVIKPSNTTAQGIDVSYRQGDIDWEKVKNSGQVDFAIIRCGFGMNETKQDDSKWKYNSSECERLGIPYGVYLYSYADTVAKAKSEANHVIRLIKGKKLSYPIYYDMEEKTVLNSTNMTRTKAAQIAQAFFSTLEAAGYKNYPAIRRDRTRFPGWLPVFSLFPECREPSGWQRLTHLPSARALPDNPAPGRRSPVLPEQIPHSWLRE